NQVELVAKYDIRRCTGELRENNVARQCQIVIRPRHRHQRRDAAAAGQEQVFVGRVVERTELAQWTYGTNLHAGFEVVMQPVGYRTAGHAFAGDGYQVRARGGRGKRITAVDGLAVDFEIKRQELSRQITKILRLLAAKQERLDVVGFFQHPAANQHIVDFGIPAAVVAVDV